MAFMQFTTMKIRGRHCEPFDYAQDKLREAISVEGC
jgi:hypothetical protein